MTHFKEGGVYKCVKANTTQFTKGWKYDCIKEADGHLLLLSNDQTPLLAARLVSQFVEVVNEPEETTMTDNQRVFDLLEYVSRGVELGVDRDIIDDLLQMIRDEVRGTENEVVEPEEFEPIFFNGVNITNIVREFERDMRANPNEVVGNPKVKAIKAIRERTGADLRDAKRFIDNYQVV